MKQVRYVDPTSVDSPKKRWKLARVLIDLGEGAWSAAEGWWDQQLRLALRWNGNPEAPLGNPHSRGLPTWFILPRELEAAVRAELSRLSSGEPRGNLAEELLTIGRRCAALTDRDTRTPDQILGYDESGLPR